LYKALVETELATAVSGGLTAALDPTLYTVSATVRNGRTAAELEAVLDEEVDQLLTNRPVTEAELAKAIKRAKAAFAYSSESVTNQGLWLGFSELMADSYTWLQSYLANLQMVTLDEIAQVAAKYLNRRRRTVGWYLPQESEE
jgi:zinc protease